MELQYSARDRSFVFVGTTRDDRDIPKSAGLRWNPDRKYWHTHDVEAANKLRKYASKQTLDALATALAAASEAAVEKAASEEVKIASSKATSSDIVIPSPEGLEYLPFQRAGIEYALGRRETLIADEQGLGKTIQVLGIANHELAQRDSNLKILIVAPKIALRNWMREAAKWLVREHSIAVWTAKSQVSADICIVNYDILSKPVIAAALRARVWDIAAYDEAHALKDYKSKRTQYALGSRKSGIEPIQAGRRLFLTGTPILNRPIELYPLLSAMGVAGCTGYYDYAKRYCAGHDTRFGFDASGASNLPELQTLLRTTVMVRRLKKDVLTELPAKRYAAVELDADTPALRACITAEAKFAKESEARIGKLKAELAALKASRAGEATVRAAMEKLRAGKSADFHEMSRLRHETALAKVPGVVEHVKEFLEGGEESLLVFAHHTDVIKALEFGINQAGYDCAVIIGETSEANRQKAQDDIQAHRKRVFIGSMRACGVAITLTAASTVVFAEQDWVPGIMRQAEDRAHRIGQESAVLVQYLVVDGSFDCTMAAKVVAKSGVIDAALDGSNDDEEAVAGQETQDIPEIAAADETPAPILAADIKTVELPELPHIIILGAKEDTLLAVAKHITKEIQGGVVKAAAPIQAAEASVMEARPIEAAPALVIPADAEAIQSDAPETQAILEVSQAIEEHPENTITVPPEMEIPAVEAPKRGRGRPAKHGVAMTMAERKREWKARYRVVDIEVPGVLRDRIAALRDARGLTTADLLAKALDALEKRLAA